MAHKYNLSIIFYPQDTGRYTAVCPELRGCIAEGATVEEAQTIIMELIPDFLKNQITDDDDRELLADGLAVPGKLFREVEVEA